METTQEHAKIIRNPFLIYIGLGLVAAILQFLLPLPFLARTSAHLLGVIVLVINMIVGLPAVLGMFAAHTSPNPQRPTIALVLSGPYRFTRNPMYIGLTLFYTGVVIFFQFAWGLILLPVVVFLITRWVIIPEEIYLEQRFGAEYASYKARVRRWL